MKIKLDLSSLASIPENVAVPAYDPKVLTPGILHIGVGNFHRAHQAVYLDRLFNQGLDLDWGLIGAGIMSWDADMRKRLQRQDWLTTVVELDDEGLTARVCAAMIDFVATQPSSLIDALTRPEIRIVSLTITEGGYFVDEKTGGVCFEHPDIAHDIAHPDTPITVFGILMASLEKRRNSGHQPFTIMSCDNAPDNGHMTRQVLVGLAKLVNPDLAEWIEEVVAFPNSMVDCITPATSKLEQDKLANLFGIEDAAPVFCEPFRQWVLEDNFPQGRPALEKVGVEFVDDVTPYELMKLRILNGGHAALAFPAALMGLTYVHDAMSDSTILGYLERIVRNEVIPTLAPLSGVSFDDYFTLIVRRFSNPEIGDTIARLCRDSSSRLPKFIFPIISDNVSSNTPCPGLTMVVAFWCLYCADSSHEDSSIVLVDEHSERLQSQATRATRDPAVFLEMEDIFGALGGSSMFVDQFVQAMEAISKDGVSNTMENYMRSGDLVC